MRFEPIPVFVPWQRANFDRQRASGSVVFIGQEPPLICQHGDLGLYICAVKAQSGNIGTAQDIVVQIGGREWRLARAGNLDDLWDNMLNDPHNFEDERLPYWTELWPSSVALAQWLITCRDEIFERPCLDLGCGLGFTALVAKWLGARVMAVDYEEDALRHARQNARINRVPQQCWTLMDWRFPAVKPQSMYCIWGGDIMYEKRFVDPVLRFLRHALAPDGVVWLAEPGRTMYENFLRASHNHGWLRKCVCSEKVEPFYAQAVPVTVNIWEMKRA